MKTFAWPYLTILAAALGLWSAARANPYDDLKAARQRNDPAAYLKIVQPLADHGEARAENDLGTMYMDGWGQPKDAAQALTWFRKAADQGFAGAQYNIGVLYANGVGGAVDDAAAFGWFKKAADQGMPEAETALGRMYLAGRGAPQDDAEAEAWIRKAVDQNYMPAALALMALSMPHQRDGATTIATADRYRRMGDGGDKVARALLNMMCMTDAGAPTQDCAQVVVWLRADADKGDTRAERDLAKIYEMGRFPGIPKDDKQAAALYLKAAEAGDATAQSLVAMRYEFGQGVPADPNQAFLWYRKAAENGEMMAQMSLARRFEDEKAGTRDDTQAFYWNQKLADQGVADAQRKVGMAYALGHGAPHDDAKAYTWLAIASKTDGQSRSEDAEAENLALTTIAKRLSANQLAEAKQAAEAWSPLGSKTPDK